MIGEVVLSPLLSTLPTPDDAKRAAELFLGTLPDERRARLDDFHLTESETLLALCQLLDSRMENAPAAVAVDAEFLYRFLESLPPDNGSFLFDELDYYLGEFALLAGGSCRLLMRRDEARQWFDRAEAWFLLTAGATADIARIAYQRLALKTEERQFSEVLRLAPALAKSFKRLMAPEFVLKARYLQAAALMETERFDEALELFRGIAREAQSLGSDRLLSSAWVAIIQIHAELGDANRALDGTAEATPILRRMNNRVGLAKLQWGLSNLLRKQGKIPQALRTLRAAQKEFAEIGMRADVAAAHLVIADLLLELGQEAQAEWEVRAALPVIDELKMVPEGLAAFALLRESVRRRKIDRQALRDVHGHFREA